MSECQNVMNSILNSGEPCVGTWRLGSDTSCGANDTKLANQYTIEQLEISGAPINVFKLLGVHEQGKLIDLTGSGFPLSGGTSADSSITNAFVISSDYWRSSQLGESVLTSPAYIGYDFGTKKSVHGKEAYAPSQPILNRISSIRIQQSQNEFRRAAQIKVERSNGELVVKNLSFSGIGLGNVLAITPGIYKDQDRILLSAISPMQFQVSSLKRGVIGLANVNSPFYSTSANFTIFSGAIPFAPGDMFMFDLELEWIRVDIINLPNNGEINLISFKNSIPSRYWKFTPLMFNGVQYNEPWEIQRIELLDYEATSVDNIQDIFLLENRDRDYSQASIQLKCQYQPFDPIGDMGKFGFNILDQYVFTCSFSQMVEKLGRPIITGDILEVCPEAAYDQNMNIVKKFVEVTDSGWAAEGYTAGWTPLIYRFTAQQLIPGQEHRDIINTVAQQKYGIDDSEFFSGISQVITQDLTSTENIKQMAADAVPERGSDGAATIASGTSLYPTPRDGSYDGRDLYIEDGLPPDDQPYKEGFSLPDMDTANDGEYFRLIYPPALKVPARLYKFSLYKRKWIYIETDRRGEYSSHKPSASRILSSTSAKSLKDTL